MSDQTDLERKVAEAEQVLAELKTRRKQIREQRQHAEIDRLEDHLESTRVRLADVRSAAGAAREELRRSIDTLLSELRRLLAEFKSRH